jgi:hypothetical protein
VRNLAELKLLKLSLHPQVLEVGIVFGVARLEPRSNSASAGAKPGGIEAPETIPSSSSIRGRDSFRSRSERDLKIVCSFLRDFLTPKNFGLCRAQIKTPPPIFIGVVEQ